MLNPKRFTASSRLVLQVTFVGEEAVDDGGVKKVRLLWFQSVDKFPFSPLAWLFRIHLTASS